MKVLVPAESRAGENRVALVPAHVGRLKAAGFAVAVQSGAGRGSHLPDEDYRTAGADILTSKEHVAAAFRVADVVVSVRPLHPMAAALLKPGAATLSFLDPLADRATIEAIATAGASALSFDLVPRTARAQPMDALTSQAMCLGYRAALVTAARLPRFMGLYMTAAGTIAPARILVLGAGVAGLQAISTSRRLGAVVSAYDVRPDSAEEIRSVGASFIPMDPAIDGSAAYGRELAPRSADRLLELLVPHVAEADAVIATAAVPGRPAPRLVSAQALAQMRPGCVVYDLFAENGGNVEGSVAGQVVRIGGVEVIGGKDVASEIPLHAATLYSGNVLALLELVAPGGELSLDLGDEVQASCLIVHEGALSGQQPVTADGSAPEPGPGDSAGPVVQSIAEEVW